MMMHFFPDLYESYTLWVYNTHWNCVFFTWIKNVVCFFIHILPFWKQQQNEQKSSYRSPFVFVDHWNCCCCCRWSLIVDIYCNRTTMTECCAPIFPFSLVVSLFSFCFVLFFSCVLFLFLSISICSLLIRKISGLFNLDKCSSGLDSICMANCSQAIPCTMCALVWRQQQLPVAVVVVFFFFIVAFVVVFIELQLWLLLPQLIPRGDELYAILAHLSMGSPMHTHNHTHIYIYLYTFVQIPTG